MKPENLSRRSHAKPDRFVRWSDEGQCYLSRPSNAKPDIGYCPDLYFGGVCHSEQEKSTYTELCAIVRDEIAHRLAKGETLPEPAVRATRDLDFAAA